MKSAIPAEVLRQHHPLCDLPTLADEQTALDSQRAEIDMQCSTSVQKLEAEIGRLRSEASKTSAQLQRDHEAALAERDRRVARACHNAIREALVGAFKADYARTKLEELMRVYSVYRAEALRTTGRGLIECFVIAQSMADLLAARDPSLLPVMNTVEFWRETFPIIIVPLGPVVSDLDKALCGKDVLGVRDLLELLERQIVERAQGRPSYAPDVQEPVRAALRCSLSWQTVTAAVEDARAPERARQRAEVEAGEARRQDTIREREAYNAKNGPCTQLINGAGDRWLAEQEANGAGWGVSDALRSVISRMPAVIGGG